MKYSIYATNVKNKTLNHTNVASLYYFLEQDGKNDKYVNEQNKINEQQSMEEILMKKFANYISGLIPQPFLKSTEEQE